MNETVVIKAHADGAPIYIRTSWKETGFEVCLLAGNVVWRAECSMEEINQTCIQHYASPVQVYINNAKRCLSTYSDNHLYELRLEDNPTSMLFVWKTKFPDGLSVKCGSLKLRPTDQKAETFLDLLLEKNNILSQNLQEISSQNDALQKELTKALKDLKQVTELKNQMESDLYGKFVQVLKSKKRRIYLLEHNLNEGSDD